MKIVVLGSGSKGNSVYIETKEAKVLIDAGLTYAETYNRLRFKNIKLEKLDAVFITLRSSSWRIPITNRT